MKVVPAVAKLPSPCSFLAVLPSMVCLAALLASPMAKSAANLVLKAQWPGYRVGWPRAMAVRNDHAYVATYPFGFQVIDLSNPALPVRVGVCDIPDARTAYGVALAANYAYVAAGAAGLRVIDISNPAQPRPLGPVGASALGVALQGTFAYVLSVGEPGLQVFDLTEPARPQPVGSYSGIYGSPSALAVSGRYGYLVAGSKGLEILDLSDPAVPTRVGACAADNPRVVAVSGDYAYLAGYPCTLEVIDVSNPTAPKVVSTVTPDSAARAAALDLVVAGDYAYAAYGEAGLYTFDVRDPANPVVVGRNHSLVSPRTLSLFGNYLCSGGDWGDELVVIDISNPFQPRVAATFDTEQDRVRGVAVSGSHAYLRRGRLEVLDVQDPTQPRSVGSFASSYRFTVQGNAAYRISGSYLEVLDITNPAAPTSIRQYDFNDPEWGLLADVAVAGDYVYVATVWNGLQILRFTDGPALKHLASYPVTDVIGDLALSGNFACLTVAGSTLQVVDVTQPAHPTLAGVYRPSQTPGLSGPLAALANRVYLANSATLEVIDISIPAKPQLVARFAGLSSSPAVEDIAVMGNHLYVAASGAGLQVYEIPALPAFNPPAVVEGQLRLSWNPSAIGMVLRQSASLTPPNWQIVSNTSSTNAITLPLGGTAGFFRLAK